MFPFFIFPVDKCEIACYNRKNPQKETIYYVSEFFYRSD